MHCPVFNRTFLSSHYSGSELELCYVHIRSKCGFINSIDSGPWHYTNGARVRERTTYDYLKSFLRKCLGSVLLSIQLKETPYIKDLDEYFSDPLNIFVEMRLRYRRNWHWCNAFALGCWLLQPADWKEIFAYTAWGGKHIGLRNADALGNTVSVDSGYDKYLMIYLVMQDFHLRAKML